MAESDGFPAVRIDAGTFCGPSRIGHPGNAALGCVRPVIAAPPGSIPGSPNNGGGTVRNPVPPRASCARAACTCTNSARARSLRLHELVYAYSRHVPEPTPSSAVAPLPSHSGRRERSRSSGRLRNLVSQRCLQTAETAPYPGLVTSSSNPPPRSS